jgi:ribonuclease E
MNFYNKRIVERKIKEKLKLDRARIQIGRISNFGLLEMTRQRLKESSIKWEMNLSLESFAQKILKKIETLAFSNKTKIISTFIPNKVSSFLNHYFRKEMLFFEKKYKFKINIIPDKDLIIPEYKIHLLNRNKKIIKKIENFKTIAAKNNNIIDVDTNKSKKNKKKITEDLGKILWTKRKARSN